MDKSKADQSKEPGDTVENEPILSGQNPKDMQLKESLFSEKSQLPKVNAESMYQRRLRRFAQLRRLRAAHSQRVSVSG